MVPRILDANGFLERLAEEIERFRRYQRPFSLVIHQTPELLDEAQRLKLVDWGSLVARNHVRASDAVGSFSDGALFAILLPETGPPGAVVVSERFASQLDKLPAHRNKGDATTHWRHTVASFPEDAEVIEGFLERFDVVIEEPRPRPGWRFGPFSLN